MGDQNSALPHSEHDSASERGGSLTPATAWMDLESIVLSETSQSQKENTVWFHFHEVPNVIKFRDRTENGGGQELGQGRGSCCSMGTQCQFEKMERVLEMDVVMVTQQEWASCHRLHASW